jgi:hypothetical protein
VVTGPSGVGKSALAIAAAQHVAERFPDGQLYLDMRQLGQPDRQAAHTLVAERILRALLVDVPGGLDRDEVTGLARTTLAGRRLLLVLDNVVGQVLADRLLPAEPGCAAIVTGPRTFDADPISLRVPLAPLSEAAAVELLAQVVGADAARADRVRADRAGAIELVRRCGGMPLAVSLAGNRLASRPHWSVRDLLDRVRTDRGLFDELTGWNDSLRDRLRSAVSEVSAVDPPAAKLLFRLRRLPVCFPLGSLAGCPDAQGRLDTLVDFHLVEALSADTFRLPDLIRAFVSAESAGAAAPAGPVRREHDPEHRIHADQPEMS